MQHYDKVAADWENLKEKVQITDSLRIILNYIRIRSNLMKC